ncbi:hypothetical protein [Bradyrhizobium sp. BR 1432]|uniref:hypothetical protein n=1 Tax=Bradyrhizobium sp. BR 1432 TaxID=3447966 RepID=UPI003EE50172
MCNEQEVLNAAEPFTGAPNDPFPPPLPHDQAIDRAQDPRPLEASPALEPSVPHDVSPEIKKAMLAAAYAQLMIDRLAALQNDEVTKYTGISRVELGLRVWNAPMAEVAKRLRMKKHVLMRICKLYEVPTPPKGYFNTSFANRPIRWTRVVVGG